MPPGTPRRLSSMSPPYGNANSDVLNVVNNALAGQQLSGQNTSVYLSDAVGNNLGTWTNAQAGQYVCVQITGSYSFILPQVVRPADLDPPNIPVSQAERRELILCKADRQ